MACHDEKLSYTWKLFSTNVTITNSCPAVPENLDFCYAKSAPAHNVWVLTQALAPVSDMKEVLKCEYTDTVAVTTFFFLTESAQTLSLNHWDVFFFFPNLQNSFATLTNPQKNFQKRQALQKLCMSASL